MVRHVLRMITVLTIAGGSLTGALAGCGSSGAGSPPSGKVVVVAAENFWGSVAAQLGGEHAEVVSLITNPATDPHEYEPTPQDARTVAQADYVIVNGAGYDSWAPKLLDASPSSDRTVITVATVAGRNDGDNPHMWYSPAIVEKVASRITADLERLDGADVAYFAQQRAHFESSSLADYNTLRAQIRARYSGVAVGATESLFVDMAHDLGLDLVTPPDYMRAVSEGNDPSAQDKATVDRQISTRRMAVLVFNRQNATTDVQALVNEARSAGISAVSMTETLDPASASFQDWQSGQLRQLAAALAKATGR